MRHKFFIYAAMMTMLVLTALATSADATRIFAGAECQLQDPSQVAATPEYGFGTIENSSTITLNVICPVVRDNTSNTNGTQNFTVRVVSNGNDDVICTSYSTDEDGQLIDNVTATTDSNVPETLNIDLSLSADKGTYSMRCVLPPGSMIINYRVNEY